MKVVRFSECLFVLGGVFLFFGLNVSAQENASSASVLRSRAITNSNPQTNRRNTSSRNTNYYSPAVSFKAPDEVAVEEFVNYHKHRLPLPKAGQAAKARPQR